MKYIATVRSGGVMVEVVIEAVNMHFAWAKAHTQYGVNVTAIRPK